MDRFLQLIRPKLLIRRSAGRGGAMPLGAYLGVCYGSILSGLQAIQG